MSSTRQEEDETKRGGNDDVHNDEEVKEVIIQQEVAKGDEGDEEDAENGGGSSRQSVRSSSRRPYRDYSQLDPAAAFYACSSSDLPPLPLPPSRRNCRRRTFPIQLHQILSDPANAHIISWMPHGRSWKVLRPSEFASKILPAYYSHDKLSSFIRLANNWGFRRIGRGYDSGSYYHEMFLRGQPELMQCMTRQADARQRKKRQRRPSSSSSSPGGRFGKVKEEEEESVEQQEPQSSQWDQQQQEEEEDRAAEPDFYRLPWLPPQQQRQDGSGGGAAHGGLREDEPAIRGAVDTSVQGVQATERTSTPEQMTQPSTLQVTNNGNNNGTSPQRSGWDESSRSSKPTINISVTPSLPLKEALGGSDDYSRRRLSAPWSWPSSSSSREQLFRSPPNEHPTLPPWVTGRAWSCPISEARHGGQPALMPRLHQKLPPPPCFAFGAPIPPLQGQKAGQQAPSPSQGAPEARQLNPVEYPAPMKRGFYADPVGSGGRDGAPVPAPLPNAPLQNMRQQQQPNDIQDDDELVPQMHKICAQLCHRASSILASFTDEVRQFLQLHLEEHLQFQRLVEEKKRVQQHRQETATFASPAGPGPADACRGAAPPAATMDGATLSLPLAFIGPEIRPPPPPALALALPAASVGDGVEECREEDSLGSCDTDAIDQEDACGNETALTCAWTPEIFDQVDPSKSFPAPDKTSQGAAPHAPTHGDNRPPFYAKVTTPVKPLAGATASKRLMYSCSSLSFTEDNGAMMHPAATMEQEGDKAVLPASKSAGSANVAATFPPSRARREPLPLGWGKDMQMPLTTCRIGPGAATSSEKPAKKQRCKHKAATT